MTSSAAKDLAALFREVPPITDKELAAHAVDGVTPRAAVCPPDVGTVGRVMAIASVEKLAVAPRGGGALSRLGNAPKRLDVSLGMTCLNRVVDHQPDDMTATVQAGIALVELRAQLARHGQQLPLDAPLPERTTIGEVLATAFAAPCRLMHGLPRDWLLGMSFVRADGALAKSGGKVVKNVTGYDVHKLHIGALGTLGVIVEATFKLIPVYQEMGAATACFPTWAAALEAAEAVRKLPFTPRSLELLDTRAATLAGIKNTAEVTIVIGLAGRRVAVSRMSADISKALKAMGASVQVLAGPESISLCQSVTDLGWKPETPPYISFRASLLPSALAQAIDSLKSLPLAGFETAVEAGPGYGGLRVLCYAKQGAPPATDAARALAAAFQQRMAALGGSAIVESAAPEVKRGLDVWGNVPGGQDVMQRLKAELDPNGILNPGRFAGGL